MSTTKLATFRIDEQLWEQFLTQAKAAGDTASAVLLRAVHNYLDSQAIALAPLSPTGSGSPPDLASSPLDSSESQPAIYLAIAPDNTILYIDRAHPSPHWIPPNPLRHTDCRFEWLSTSDPTLLSALEDCLIDAFNPPLNFRPNTQSHPLATTVKIREEKRYDLPPEISAKVQHLLSSGFTTLDVLTTLDAFTQPKPETPPKDDSVILQHLEALTKSITTLTSLQQQWHSRIAAVEDTLTQERKPKQRDSTHPRQPNPIEVPKTKTLKGTAALDQIPQQPENTRSLAQRWGITDKILTRQRQRYQDRPDGFFLYSLEKEQGKFGWIYDAENQLYYAVTELPSDTSTSNAIASPTPNQPKTQTPIPPLAEDKPKALPSPHTAAQLGQRFLSPRTGKRISAKAIAQALKRHHQEPDSFAQYCRHRDPDGFAWQGSKTDKLFVCLG